MWKVSEDHRRQKNFSEEYYPIYPVTCKMANVQVYLNLTCVLLF